MPARMVKTFKKELGHRMHRDHRTRREPIGKRARALRTRHRRKVAQDEMDELDRDVEDFISEFNS